VEEIIGKLAISEMMLFDESSEQNFIKVILTKDQERSKRNKE